MYKQLIIVRKDLNMSVGKTAAQVSHASMAFLTCMIQSNTTKIVKEHYYHAWEDSAHTIPQLYKRSDLCQWAEEARKNGKDGFYARLINPNTPNGELMLCEPTYDYTCHMTINKDLYEQWLGGIFTKIVCEAKNKNQLMKAITIANDMGMVEGKDYFIIRDACLTELEPEEFDANGVGRTITCIGFAPMNTEQVEKISKKFQLLK